MNKFKSSISIVALISVLLNLLLPYAFVSKVFAQESPASLALTTSASESLSSLIANTVIAAPEPSPTVTPAPLTENQAETPSASINPTPQPIAEPSTVTASPISPIEPISTPSPSAIPTPEPASPGSGEASPQGGEPTSTPVPGPVPTPSIWKSLDSKASETIDNVETGKDYTAPQNDKVKVNFTKLPDSPGKLTIKEVKLSPDQVKQLKATSDTAYDITSTLTDETFAYDLTLPLPEQAKGKKIEIKSAESSEELSKAVNVDEPKEEKANTIIIKGLNHFTIFVVTDPAVNAKAVSATIDANNGYPNWYSDNNGIQLTPCLDGTDPKCVLPGAGEESNFDPKKPTDFPGNFPSEFFYYIAESDILNTPGGGKFMMRFAVEGAFLNDDPAPSEQITFGRIRATGTSLQPNSTYTVIHPYGEDSYETDSSGVIARKSGTEDIGCEVAPCDFGAALQSRVFNGFLRWDSGAPDGYLGDGVSAKTVTGSKTGNNFVKITGPGLPEGGLTTDKFTVAGKLLAITPPAPNPNPNPNPDPICTNTAPDKPTLKSPQNNIIDAPFAQTLSWNPINSFGVNCQGNTNKFEVFFSEGIEPADSIGEIDANLKDKIVSNLKTSTVYSWKVRARNGNLFTDSDAWMFTTAAVKSALRAVSNPLHESGFPSWYSDDNGIKVGPCLDGTDPICVLPAAGEEPNWNPDLPTKLPGNFPSEFFYWIAESDFISNPNGGKVSVRVALEGAFLNEEPVEGDQMVFGRIRVTGTKFEPNSTYVVTHPFGMDIYQSDALGTLRRTTSTEDIGCFAAPCNFKTALDSRVFGAFLRWDSGAPDGYLGDAITPHTITGSPTGNNFFKIQGPGLPDGGLTTDLFTVSGKIATEQNLPPQDCKDSSPDKPVLIGPANQATGISRNPVTSWEGVTNFGINCLGNANQVEVFLSEGNINPTASQGSFQKSATSFNVLNLKADTTYSWKIRSKNGALFTDSDIRTFSTTALSEKSVSSSKIAANGYPDWYSDNTGIKVAPCLEGADPNCVLPGAGEEPNFDPALPAELPGNFPSEFFYLLVESDPISVSGVGQFNMRFAVEGAFTTEDPELDKQIVFGRVRATGTGLTPNSTYTVTHPYGVDTYQTDATGVITRTSATEDIGCGGNPCDFAQALVSRVFDGFLRWDNSAPAGYLGDAGVAHKVTGSPNGTNFVKIEGPGLPDGGLTTDLFNVSGKLFAEPVVSNPNPPVAPPDSPVIVNPPVVNPPAPVPDGTGQAPADQKGSITIIEKSLPQDSQDFEFSRSSNGGNFFLSDDNNSLGDQLVMSDLSPNSYKFNQLTMPNGWTLTNITCADPNNSSTVDLTTSTASIDLNQGENITCTFTNSKKGSISGKLYNDKNDSGTQDASELGLAGWTVYLDTNDNGALDLSEPSTTTDSNGHYQFNGLLADTYNIRTVSQDSWSSTKPTDGKATVLLTPGDATTGKDFGYASYQSVGGQGKFILTSTTSVTALGSSTLTVNGNGGTYSVTIPDGTVITRNDGGNFDLNQLSLTIPTNSALTGFASNITTEGYLQWGIPSVGLVFSKPITLSIFVGTALNSQTLDIIRSVNSDSGWTSDGILAPATCVVSNGTCSFQATKASYYVAARTTPASSQTIITTSSSSTQATNNTNVTTPVCTDSKPGSIPVLSLNSTGENAVTLSWTKALDPVTYYLLAFGLSSGDLQYGNPNIGGKDVTSYTVRGLSAGTTYYFKVRAGNGCTPGDFSNEVKSTPSGVTLTTTPQGFTTESLATPKAEDAQPKQQVLGTIQGSNSEKTVASNAAILNGFKYWSAATILLLILTSLGIKIYRRKTA